VAKSLRTDLLEGPGSTAPGPEVLGHRARGVSLPPARGPPTFLGYSDLLARGIPWTRPHLRRLEMAGLFPKRVSLGSGNGMQATIAWVFDEIVAWEKARIAERGSKKPSRPSVAQHAGTSANAATPAPQ
jgi:predicted DNA-binding transcriptional regulator AlpA